jgi:hypothetical protein
VRRRSKLAGVRDHRWIDETSGRLSWPRAAPGGDPRRTLYFLHVPKTAGLSLGGFLRSLYREEEVCPAYLEDELEPFASTLSRYRYIAGHFSLRPIELLPEPPAIVTIIREPGAHLRSFYEHGRRDPTNPYPDLWEGRTYEDWLQARDTELHNANPQAKHLAGFVRDEMTPPDDELFERAAATLDRCLWYSTTEQLDTSIGGLAAALDWPAPEVAARVNVAPTPHSPAADRTEELVLTRAPVDFQLFRHVEAALGHAGVMLDRTRYDRALDRAAVALDRPLVVEMAEPFWGSGWWAPERVDGRLVRWTTLGRQASIDLSVRVRRGDRIDVFVSAAAEGRFVTELEAETNGQRAELRDVHPCAPCFVAPFEVVSDSAGWTRLTLRSPGDDRGPRDVRGVAVERIVIVPGASR